MTHLCFFALFSSKPRKWNGLRAGETVAQAVSGRLVLASHRTFSADPCQADPQPPPLSVRNVRPPFRIRTTHQT